jgi:hypothetical protein
MRLQKHDGDEPRRNTIWLSPDTYCVREFETAAPSSSPVSEGKAVTDARSAKRFLESVIARHVVIIGAIIRVEYQGRASSVADKSQRIVMTKPDGTLIIHEDTKHRPLNWQPPGTSFHFSVKDGSTLTLEAYRKKDRETVTIWFDEIFYIAASKITPGEFRFSGSESEMVDLVIRNPGLIEEGFVPEKREFKTRSGHVDLMGRDKDGNILLLEFKRRQAQLASASQLDRYVVHFAEAERLNQKLEPGSRKVRGKRASFHPANQAKEDRKNKVRGGIVAPNITADALLLLKKHGYEFFKLEPRVESVVTHLETVDAEEERLSSDSSPLQV